MISLIVAFDRHQLIGSKNRLPWHYKEDLAYFKQTTMGHDILMGRQTFESILSYQNKPLPNRHHYVLTTTTDYDYEEVTVLANWKTIIENYPLGDVRFMNRYYLMLIAYISHILIKYLKEIPIFQRLIGTNGCV